MALPWPCEGGRGSTLASPGLQFHFTIKFQLCQTISSTISSTSTLNYPVVSKYGSVDTEN